MKAIWSPFGIVPNAPETGYGYIQRGVALTDSAHAPYRGPLRGEAGPRARRGHLASGEYYWNSGMFMFRAKKYLSELAKYRPDILETCQAAVNAADNGSDFINIPHDIFCECPDESVDYAVMEKTADAVVVCPDADWSDVGSRPPCGRSARKMSRATSSAATRVHNSENCYINSDEKLVAAIGVENLVIVSTKDAVLVMNRERSRDVKKAVEFLKQNQRSEYKRHREIYRPRAAATWWSRPALQRQPHHGETGGAFSMQMHHHRAEHWVILAGTGQVTVNGKQFLLSENQSTFIPIGAEHCLENPGCIPLEVLEIQSGSYLGEDDIIRIKDQYGRC
ncbi:hypothetical protein ECZU45_00030 [Escherichia coli]|nr:hypothetical protein ECZU45_00030 [Escherichia coli]